MAATESFRILEHDPASALAAVGSRADLAFVPIYRYEGPFGPVHEAHTQDPPMTRLWGSDVPIGTFDVGPPMPAEYRGLRRSGEPVAAGAIGHQPVTIRISAQASERVGALTIALGTARYELSSSGIWPRVVLYRDDLTEVATYTVVGRRHHRIAPGASPEEVVLVAFLARYAHRMAFRR